MENLLLLFATSLVWRISAPKFKRYLIGRTGCSSLLLTGETTLHIQPTKDGERVYFYEHDANGVTYGLITVNMKNLHTIEQAESILVQYVNRIRRPFGISHNVYQEMEKSLTSVSLTDYWQDEEGIDWKIRAVSNGKIVAVLYVKNIGDAAAREHDAYLNGFRFPAA